MAPGGGGEGRSVENQQNTVVRNAQWYWSISRGGLLWAMRMSQAWPAVMLDLSQHVSPGAEKIRNTARDDPPFSQGKTNTMDRAVRTDQEGSWVVRFSVLTAQLSESIKMAQTRRF